MSTAIAPEPKISVGGAISRFVDKPEIQEGLKNSGAENGQTEPPKPAIAEPVKEAPKPPVKAEESVFPTSAPKPVAAPVAEPVKIDKAERKWNEMRTENDTLRSRLEAMEKANKELGEKSNQADELPSKLTAMEEDNKALRAQLSEYEQELSVTAVERTKDFQREVVEPKTKLTASAEAIATKYSISPKKLVAALREPVETRGEALEELSGEHAIKATDQQSLLLLAMQLDDIDSRAEQKRNEARSKRDQTILTQKGESEAAAKERHAKTAAALKANLANAAAEYPFLGTTGKTDWDAEISGLKLQVEKADLNDPTELAEGQAARVKAHAFKKGMEHYRSLYEQAQQDRTALEERLSKYEKLAPALGGNGHASDAPVENDTRSVGQRIASSLAAGKFNR